MTRFSVTKEHWTTIVTSCVILLALIPGISAAPYAIGDSIPISGTAYGIDQMYLFVTGPDLPSNGVNPYNMNNEVVTGNAQTFAVVETSDGSWSYTWVTAQIGIKLKEGIYTFYSVKGPVGKDDLSANDPSFYSSTEITLTKGGRPYYSNGWILVRSDPSGATIYLNDQVSGSTPRNLTAPIGTSTLRLEMTGYVPAIKEVTVERGEVAIVDPALIPIQTTVIPTPTTEAPTLATTKTTLPAQKQPLSAFAALVALACGVFVLSLKRN